MTEIDTAEIRARITKRDMLSWGEMQALCDEIDRLRLALKMQIEGNAEQVAAARAEALEEAWNKINSYIKVGHLEGNGCDAVAQRNGLILAANAVLELRALASSGGEKGAPEIQTCPKCGAQAVAFICSERGCPVNGGAAYA